MYSSSFVLLFLDIISLTNTKKFYDPNDFNIQGITHYDYRVGSGKVPKEEELKKWV